MNKKALIRTISLELNSAMSQDRIALILDKAVEITKRTLAFGEPVRWSGFGSFVVKDIPPRRFYSTRLGECTTSKGTK
ncbi:MULTISPECIES: HU family DNA-binding protein [Bacteroides]|uniref:HU family DNA-binding protein n=1 Tax=Bacteroides TaxID=816 RepID=UPI00033ED82A|nr:MULTISPECIES: HU family DNA-binding protein [Bacteroides]UBD15814.1 HU family DNA-binding protein [Bacteroides salyersiae]UYU46277.1 HU family DNA-binding protein [Bacteroides salyersiae]CCY49537.1 dNA binding protein HU family [Bacteroides sp. CAG:189]